MDIARPSNLRKKRIRTISYATAAVVVAVLLTVGLTRLQPAAPAVEAATLWSDTIPDTRGTPTAAFIYSTAAWSKKRWK